MLALDPNKDHVGLTFLKIYLIPQTVDVNF
jgi:hypothetical protein